MRRSHEHDLAEEAKAWIKAQPVDERAENLTGLCLQYQTAIQNKVFMSELDIANISKKALVEEFKKERFTKFMSKKMRAKMDGKVILHHSPKKQTAVFTEIAAHNRKKIGYTYSVVNYFDSPGGYIYVLRVGVPYPELYFFTGHFFDRLLERGFNNKDHAARMQAIFRLMRHVERGAGRVSSYICLDTNRAYLGVLGGLGIGTAAFYKEWPPELDFMFDNVCTTDPDILKKPAVRAALLFFTYVNETLLGAEQRMIYKSLIRPKGKAHVET